MTRDQMKALRPMDELIWLADPSRTVMVCNVPTVLRNGVVVVDIQFESSAPFQITSSTRSNGLTAADFELMLSASTQLDEILKETNDAD